MEEYCITTVRASSIVTKNDSRKLAGVQFPLVTSVQERYTNVPGKPWLSLYTKESECTRSTALSEPFRATQGRSTHALTADEPRVGLRFLDTQLHVKSLDELHPKIKVDRLTVPFPTRNKAIAVKPLDAPNSTGCHGWPAFPQVSLSTFLHEIRSGEFP